MRSPAFLLFLFVLPAVASAFGIVDGPHSLESDPGPGSLSDCALAYYYHIPWDTYGYYWAWQTYEPGAMIGAWFEVGDLSIHGYEVCDPTQCHTLEEFCILDFTDVVSPSCARYGQVEFNIYCADETGCPLGPSLWSSGSMDVTQADHYVYVPVDPAISICGCAVDPGPPPSAPRILITATHIAPYCGHPRWGVDLIGAAVEEGIEMHDYGCLPALYPRPNVSYYETMHSGYYGVGGFEHCPPLWLKDKSDTTPDGSLYGYCELAWTLFLSCHGPTDVSPTSWGSIKAMYR
jgi:hypothetical protein